MPERKLVVIGDPYELDRPAAEIDAWLASLEGNTLVVVCTVGGTGHLAAAFKMPPDWRRDSDAAG